MGAGNCLFLTGKMRFDVLGFIPGGGGEVVLCTGAGGPEPEPEFCPILPEPELEPEFVHLRQNSGSTYLCCKLLS